MLAIKYSLLIVLLQLSRTAWSACNDGKNNLLTVADASPDNVIKLSDGVGNSYDSNNNPSCYKNTANIRLPGIINLVSGTINVTKKLNVVGNSKILLTMRKNSHIIGYVCKDGKSQHSLVPDSDCNINTCATSEGICKALEQPGVHKLGELEHDLGINGTIPLPSVSKALKPLIRGQWKVEVKLMVGSEMVLHARAPIDTDWLWMEE